MLGVSVSPEAATAQAPLPRVGDELDQYELAYFGLFPLVRGAVSGRVEREAGAAVVVLDLAGGEERRVSLSKAQFASLADGLQAYEACEQGQFSQRPSSEESLQQSEEEASLQGVLFCHGRKREGRSVQLHRSEAPPVEGELLYADERGIAVWVGPGAFDSRRLDQLRVLPWPEVMAFRVDRSLTRNVTGRIPPAVAIGGAGWLMGGVHVAGGQDAGPAVLAAIVSGLAAATAMRRPLGGDQWEGWTGGEPEAGRDLALRLSKKGAMAFENTLAPEVMAALDEARSRPVEDGQPAEPLSRDEWSRQLRERGDWFKRVHISAGASRVGLGTGQAQGATFNGFSQAFVSGSFNEQNAAYYGEAAFAWGRRFRTGVAGRLRYDETPDRWEVTDTPGRWGVTQADRGLALFAEYVVVARTPTSRSLWNRLEVSVALGGGMGETETTLQYSYPVFSEATGAPVWQTEMASGSARGAGLYAKASAHIYASESLSLGVSVGYRGMPEAALPAASGGTLPFLSEPLYAYDNVRSQPSPLEVFVGIGWHLW